MDLLSALKQLANDCGKDVLKSPQLVNMLADYQAFEDNPAHKFILIFLINQDYIPEFLEYGRWDMRADALIKTINESTSFSEQEVKKLLNSIAVVSGWETNEDLDLIDIANNNPFDWRTIFPIFGITLGKTTWEEAKKRCQYIERYDATHVSEGCVEGRLANNIHLWDWDLDGVFETLHWLRGYRLYEDMNFDPYLMRLGFSWENSYDEWIQVMQNIDFVIQIKDPPHLFNSQFWAKIEATSKDRVCHIELQFGCGEEGNLSTSPNTLLELNIQIKEQ